MEIEFLGAAQTVTGSMHLVRAAGATVLLDCGLFQGRRMEALERNRNLPVPVDELDAVVLSHAHIDHSGALPLLARRGYRGPIYCTPATRDLSAVMLEDAAMIQESDARFVGRLIARGHRELEPVAPLYDGADVVAVLSQMIAVPYHVTHALAPGVRFQFLDAGHVLGSAIVVLDADEDGARRRLVFSGDLGRRRVPILRDPEIPTGAHALVLESTYGDRLHDPIEALDEKLAAIVRRTVERGGKVLIPSFALERAQEVILAFKRLRDARAIPPIPVIVDSPLTVRVTDVFRMHPDCYDHELTALLERGESPFDYEGLRYVTDVEESKAVDASPEPAVIVAASGMCEFGRVLHHLRALIGDRSHTVVIVGFQAQHTLGRRLVEQRPRVRIFGVEHDRHCDVAVLNGFSAHADQRDLVDFAVAARERGPLRHVALVHGEPPAQGALKDLLHAEGFPAVAVPAPRDRLRI